MSKLDDLLALEEEVCRREERVLRQFAAHIRGLRDEHVEPIIQMHLKNCSEYFAEHGTIDGPCSPWKIGNGRMPYAKEDC